VLPYFVYLCLFIFGGVSLYAGVAFCWEVWVQALPYTYWPIPPSVDAAVGAVQPPTIVAIAAGALFVALAGGAATPNNVTTAPNDFELIACDVCARRCSSNDSHPKGDIRPLLLSLSSWPQTTKPTISKPISSHSTVIIDD
jgi:hypothetical protein